jgi:hypothetical protein
MTVVDLNAGAKEKHSWILEESTFEEEEEGMSAIRVTIPP